MPDYHADVAGEIWPLLDNSLDEQFRQEVRAHLADCPECGRRYAFEQALRSLIRRRCGEVAPGALDARIRQLMDRFQDDL